VQYLMEKLVRRVDAVLGTALPFDLANAVAAQVERIVLCRPQVASGVRLNDFGMPSVVEMGGGRVDLEAYGALLRRAIERYEPRLRNVSVAWTPSGRALSPRTLVVVGELTGDAGPFRFELADGGMAA
jgi:predicted component of type VI protein secretion system